MILLETMLQEYEITLKQTRKQLKEIKDQLIWCEKSKEKHDINAPVWKESTEKEEQLLLDKKIVSSIIRDLEFTVQWLSTGRQPGTKKGIDSLAAYQIEKPFDPYLMQLYVKAEPIVYEWEFEPSEEGEEKEKLAKQILSVLSKKEKEILMLSVNGLSQYEIADTLQMPRETVRDTVRRSKEKIEKEGWVML